MLHIEKNHKHLFINQNQQEWIREKHSVNVNATYME